MTYQNDPNLRDPNVRTTVRPVERQGFAWGIPAAIVAVLLVAGFLVYTMNDHRTTAANNDNTTIARQTNPGTPAPSPNTNTPATPPTTPPTKTQ